MLKKIYQFKFTFIYSVVFFYLGELVLAGPAFLGGFLIDIAINKSRNNRKSCPTIKYWFIYFGIIGVLYPIVIFSAIDPDTSSGLIYNWINFTQPFADAMANLIPAIDVYAKQIADFDDGWRVPKFRHLYAIFWFTNILAAGFLYMSIIDLIYYLNLKDTLFEFKKTSYSLKKINLLLGIVIMLFSLVSLVMMRSYFGSELLPITYNKGRYMQWPFILFSSLYAGVLFLTLTIILNIKYAQFRKSHG